MKNVILATTVKGHKYANIIKNYIDSKGINTIVCNYFEVGEVIDKYNLTPKDTIIHSRSAGVKPVKVMSAIEEKGFRVVNPSLTLQLTSNKYLSQIFARESGLPVADTYKVDKNDIETVILLLKKYNKLVLKPKYSKGQGVFCQLISTIDSKEGIIQKMKIVPGKELVVQQYIKYNKLIRTIVVDYKVVDGSYTYDVPNESWKCSVCLNPNIKKYIPESDILKELAETTARKFKAHVNFIDFFQDEEGKFILNEINTACSLIFHEQITGVKIHEYIGNFLIAELNKI